MNCGTMLNAYPDSMGGRLGDIAGLLAGEAFRDAFRSLYVLPSVFHSDLDRGFSIISYDLNRTLAAREDIDSLRAAGLDLKLDFVLNHLSVLSPQFQDILKNGDASPYRDFFIDWNRFWAGCGEMTPEGYIKPEEAYLRDMFFRKPGLPILMARLPDGREVPYWNTFYQEVRYDPVDAQDLMRAMDVQYGEAQQLAARVNAGLAQGKRPAQLDFTGFETLRGDCVALLESRRKYLGQMDLNLRSEQVWAYYDSVLAQLADYGASIVRLDAFAYAPKAPGRRNFMNEPETWETLERIRGMAERYGLTLLPEIHDPYEKGTYEKIAKQGYMTYDFFLPGLVIDAIESGDGHTLLAWAQELREKYPEHDIRCVDTFGASGGFGLLLYMAVQKKREGGTIEECEKVVLDNRFHLCHWFTVDDLVYLKRGGRISSATAFVGNALGFKPVLHMDDAGHLINMFKVRGRKASLNAMADKYGELALDKAGGTVFISHGDCRADADTLAAILKERYGASVKEIVVVGPVIGAHSGPGTLALFFLGEHR